jgi:gamma-glutamylcyclotransferase (GGCT)/AIG2-like uncharacterized protein YtfP
MSQKVFAYGSNMCSGRFRDYRVSPEAAAQGALLTGYRLRFNKRSTLDGSGKANVEANEGSEIWGVVYSIRDGDLHTLDKGEGGYRRIQLRVRTMEHVNIDAWVYIAARPDNDPSLRPYTWYKRFFVEGAREHSLPPAYIAELEYIEAVSDPNAQREREKRALACQAKPRLLFPEGGTTRKR